MKATLTITSRGVVTLPAKLRNALGLKAERQNVLGGIFGTVRDQSVVAGESVPKGTTIRLTVV